MRHLTSLATLALAPLLGSGPVSAQDRPEDVVEETPIIVSGVRPHDGILVSAPPRCRKRKGDPYDSVPVPRGVGGPSVIGPDANCTVRHHEDDQPVLGPAVWQRAGNAIGDYVFRVPVDGEAVCMGTGYATTGYAVLRRIVSAEGTKGKYLHFSARVSTRKAWEVRLFLVAGEKQHRRGLGGDTRAKPIRGTQEWQRVDLVVGPVPDYAHHISYGLVLQGRGDVWLADPKLEILTREQALQIDSLPASPVGNARPR